MYSDEIIYETLSLLFDIQTAIITPNTCQSIMHRYFNLSYIFVSHTYLYLVF